MSDSLLMLVVLIPSMLSIGCSLCWLMLGCPVPAPRNTRHWLLGDPPHQHQWSNNMVSTTGVQAVTYTCRTCGAVERKTVSVVCE